MLNPISTHKCHLQALGVHFAKRPPYNLSVEPEVMQRFLSKMQQTKNSAMRCNKVTKEARQERVNAAKAWKIKYEEYMRQGTVPPKWRKLEQGDDIEAIPPAAPTDISQVGRLRTARPVGGPANV